MFFSHLLRNSISASNFGVDHEADEEANEEGDGSMMDMSMEVTQAHGRILGEKEQEQEEEEQDSMMELTVMHGHGGTMAPKEEQEEIEMESSAMICNLQASECGRVQRPPP